MVSDNLIRILITKTTITSLNLVLTWQDNMLRVDNETKNVVIIVMPRKNQK